MATTNTLVSCSSYHRLALLAWRRGLSGHNHWWHALRQIESASVAAVFKTRSGHSSAKSDTPETDPSVTKNGNAQGGVSCVEWKDATPSSLGIVKRQQIQSKGCQRYGSL